MGQALLNKVWNNHAVRILSSGQTQLFVGLHLVHEVTSPQAFSMAKDLGRKPMFPSDAFATADHIIPTHSIMRPYGDPLAETMMAAMEVNTSAAGIRLFDRASGRQGIVHVIGPELGLTQPGMTIACGDSHTSTHGAFGAIAFGIGTSQVRDVLLTQCIAMAKPKLRRILVTGMLSAGVYAKDVILEIIRQLGVNGGVGFAYEYAGEVFDRMTMEERLTVCNMSIEGGARLGYINPDDTTYAYLDGRPFAPQGEERQRAIKWWRSMASDKDASYDDTFRMNVDSLAPIVTWGINPGQSTSVDQPILDLDSYKTAEERVSAEQALKHMKFGAGDRMIGKKVDVAFIGSCTNSRKSDILETVKVIQKHGGKVPQGLKAIVVPGSMEVHRECEAEGLHEIIRSAGFEWREPGCSMCLAMNPDKLIGDQMSASSSNRNFVNRQGSPTGRTLLMSPAMVALAALEGSVQDVRQLLVA